MIKTKVKLLVIAISLFLIPCLSVQSQNWLWAKSGNSNATSNGWNVLVNTNDNIYCHVSFNDSIILDTTTFIVGDGLITQFSPSGSFINAGEIRQLNGQSNYSANLYNDNHGNIFTIGQIHGNVRFDTINTSSFYYGYIAKFNSSLSALWVKHVGDANYSVAFDNDNNAYITGEIDNPLTYIDTFTLYNSTSNPLFHPKFFMAKIDSSKNCQWTKQCWEGGGLPGDIKLFGNYLYMFGRVDSCFLFDTATICNTRPIGSSFLVKTDTDGNVIWAKNYTSAKSAFFSAMSIDNSGNSYVAGWFDSTLTIGGITLQKTVGSNRNTFLVRYNSNGTVAWAKQIGCSGDMLGEAINTDDAGNTYITGNFSGTAFFGTDSVAAQSISDMYVTRFNNNGDCLGFVTVPTAQSYDIAQDSDDNAIVTGDIKTGTTYFDSIALTTSGTQSFFLAKLSPITGPNSLKTIEEDNSLKIYPNPNNKTFMIEVPEGLLHSSRTHLSIYDNSGKAIKEEDTDISNSKVMADIGTVQKGIYTVILSSGSKKFTGRVVVE